MKQRKKDSKESFDHAGSTVQSDRSFESLKRQKNNISEERTTAYDPRIDKLNADLPMSKMNVTSVQNSKANTRYESKFHTIYEDKTKYRPKVMLN